MAARDGRRVVVDGRRRRRASSRAARINRRRARESSVCHAVSASDAGGLLSGYVRRASRHVQRGPDLMGGAANVGPRSDLGVGVRSGELPCRRAVPLPRPSP